MTSLTAIRPSPSGRLLALNTSLLEYGLQSNWVIDPINGDDGGVGDSSQPLRTIEEWNFRLANNTIYQPTTVTCLGDVAGTPIVNNLALTSAASLTFAGTVTDEASFTIASVTALGPSTTFPWQLTTTGIDWTTVTNATQMRIRNNTTGDISWIVRVIDANNIEVGGYGPKLTGTLIQPPTGAYTAQSCSTIDAPFVRAFQLGLSSGISRTTFQDFDFTSGTAYNINDICLFAGCRFTLATASPLINNAVLGVRLCQWTTPAAGTCTSRGSGILTLTGSSIAGGGGFLRFLNANVSLSTFFGNNSPILIQTMGGSGSGINIRNTATPFTVQAGGQFQNGNVAMAGNNNTGIGITVQAGAGFTYTSGGSAKPTLTGAGGDTSIGTTIRTYAQIPYVNLQLNAIPPTLTTLTGNTAFMVVVS